jgi:hypothetical protein
MDGDYELTPYSPEYVTTDLAKMHTKLKTHFNREYDDVANECIKECNKALKDMETIQNNI